MLYCNVTSRTSSRGATVGVCQVSVLVVEEQDLVIATHGRSFYVLDNVESLRQLSPEILSSPAHLFEPGPAYRRARPASIDFLMKAGAASVTIEVLDRQGRTVKRFAGDSLKKPGLNRVRWDLRYPGATTFPGLILRSATPERGPWAPSGAYRVRLTVDGQTHERPLSVLAHSAYLRRIGGEGHQPISDLARVRSHDK